MTDLKASSLRVPKLIPDAYASRIIRLPILVTSKLMVKISSWCNLRWADTNPRVKKLLAIKTMMWMKARTAMFMTRTKRIWIMRSKSTISSIEEV